MNTIASLFPTILKSRKVSKNEDESWGEKAVESLVKKLTKINQEALKTLEEVLERRSPDTPCVTIANTQDGRMQIHHRKIFPHVAYCKVWRFPDLKNQNELKPVPAFCSKSFYSKQDVVCINPYHYERVQSNMYSAASSPQSFNQNSLSNSSSFSTPPHIMMIKTEPIDEQLSPSIDYSMIDNSINQSIDRSINHLINQSNDRQFMNQSLDDHSMNHPYFLNVESPSPNFQQISSPKMYSDYSYPNSPVDFCSNNNVNEIYESYMDTNQVSHQTLPTFRNIQTNSCYSKSTSCNWCSVVFFENKKRLDHKKMISLSQDTISGRDLPKHLLQNQGIQIYKNGNGEVYIECCNCEVYIQSPFLNWSRSLDLKSVVELHALQQAEARPVQIFNENLFKQAIQKNYNNFDALFNLTKFSKCILSFNFNWIRHGEITQSPCWLEISMDGALSTYLDKPLAQLRSSNQQVTSVS